MRPATGCWRTINSRRALSGNYSASSVSWKRCRVRRNWYAFDLSYNLIHFQPISCLALRCSAWDTLAAIRTYALRWLQSHLDSMELRCAQIYKMPKIWRQTIRPSYFPSWIWWAHLAVQRHPSSSLTLLANRWEILFQTSRKSFLMIFDQFNCTEHRQRMEHHLHDIGFHLRSAGDYFHFFRLNRRAEMEWRGRTKWQRDGRIRPRRRGQ